MKVKFSKIGLCQLGKVGFRVSAFKELRDEGTASIVIIRQKAHVIGDGVYGPKDGEVAMSLLIGNMIQMRILNKAPLFLVKRK